MNKSIITVVGKDKVGIIAKICTYLSAHNINVLDISQTIVGGYFNMMMVVNAEYKELSFADTAKELEQLGKEIGVIIHIQKEEIFNLMHRV